MTPTSDMPIIDKQDIRKAFNAATSTYEEAAAMQNEAGRRLLERLLLVKETPTTILELGSSCGRFARALQSRYPTSQVIAVDFAEQMLGVSRTCAPHMSHLCADIEALPIQDNSIDLIFSNMTFQWVHSLDTLFKECQRVLKPNGMLFFTSLGPDTLCELRDAWAEADAQHGHVNLFLDMHEYGDALLHAGLHDPVMDVERLCYLYPNVMTLLRELQATGAYNQLSERRDSLTGKARFKQMISSYETLITTDDRIPVTYEIIFGHAVKQEGVKEKKAPPGFQSFSMEEMRAMLLASS